VSWSMCDHRTGGKRNACGASGACPRSEVRPTGPISAGAPGAATRLLWVHQCHRTVALQATPARMRPSRGGQIQLDKRVDGQQRRAARKDGGANRRADHKHLTMVPPAMHTQVSVRSTRAGVWQRLHFKQRIDASLDLNLLSKYSMANLQ
jgi:hypothetical protein